MAITKVKVNGNWELASPTSGSGAVSSVNGQTGTVVLDADDVGALPDSTTIPTKTSDLQNDSGFTTNSGTVTSVRVQATSPVSSSVSTAQSTSLNTTISLSDAYGDTKNPYGSKTKNQVLAAPNGSNGTPGFRALVAADIPDLSGTYLTSAPVTSVNSKTGAVSLSASDVGALPSSTTIPQGTVTSVRVQATSPVSSSVSTEQTSSLNTTISLASGYGDTQNPYGSKTKNYVLAAPSNANGNPSFRALTADDIPDLSGTYLTSAPVTSVNSKTGAVSLSASDVSALPSTTTASDIGALPLSAGSGNALTGDLYFSSGKQQIGGHKYATKTESDSKSVSANTNTTVNSITNMDSSGVYLVVAKLNYQPSASTGHSFTMYLGTSGTDYKTAQQDWTASTGNRPHHITAIVTGLTTCNLIVNTQSSSITGTVSSSIMYYVRLA